MIQDDNEIEAHSVKSPCCQINLIEIENATNLDTDSSFNGTEDDEIDGST